MPGTRISDRFNEHLRNVEILSSTGIKPPREWAALRERFASYQQLRLPACERLIATLITPAKGDDVALWHGLALAETANPMAQATVDNAVSAAVERRLLELYRPSARSNYEKAADRFDSAASEFAAAATVIDAEAPAATVVNASDDERAAWSTAERAAAELDAVLPTLVAASELANIHITAQDGTVLMLCVDPGNLHRRRLWQAFETRDGRTRRWGALAKIGATIRACALDDIKPYAQPRPLERRVEKIPGGERVFWTDPESDDYIPPRPPAVGMISGRMVAG